MSIKSAEKTDAGILENLLELYLHDFSEFAQVEIGLDGRFGYPFLDKYWDDPNRAAFLIMAGEQLAGFTLVRQEIDPDDGTRTMDLAEFFVLRQFRRQQIGSRAAITLFSLFPGRWQVRVLESNRSACSFWTKLITTVSADQFEESEECGLLGAMIQFVFEGKVEADKIRR